MVSVGGMLARGLRDGGAEVGAQIAGRVVITVAVGWDNGHIHAPLRLNTDGDRGGGEHY